MYSLLEEKPVFLIKIFDWSFSDSVHARLVVMESTGAMRDRGIGFAFHLPSNNTSLYVALIPIPTKMILIFFFSKPLK